MSSRASDRRPWWSPAVFAVAALMAALPSVSTAATPRTFYVDSQGGADSNSGRSTGAAWRTLGRVEAASLAPGDRVRFRRDRVWSGGFDIGWSGTSDAPITFDAYGTGALPVITGSSTCISVPGSHVVIRYLRAAKCTWAGISVGGDHVRIDHSRVSGNAAGIVVKRSAYATRVLRNRIVDNRRMSVLTEGGDDDSGAFGVLLQGDRTEIAFNTISGHDAFSYDYGRDGAAVEVYGARASHVHHNVGVNNHTFTELGNARSADNRFAYNLVRSSLANSTFLVTRGAASGWGPVLRTTLYNNTVIMTGSGSQGFVCHAGCGADILTMRNNIVRAVRKVGYADAPFDGNYNLYWVGQRQFRLGARDLVADPRFATSGGLLGSASPAIDSGVTLAYTFDLTHGSIVGRTDRGAYEYRG